jgi:hypothetical protein
MTMTTLAAILALSCAAAPALHVGVTDFNSTKELKPLASALNGLVANELQRMGTFQVTSAEQVRTLFSLERQQQLLGCGDDKCRGGVIANLGFDSVVSGTVTRFAGNKDKPAALTLELLLLEVKTGARTGSEVVTAPSEAELMSRVSPGVAKLVGKLLKERSGSLVVTSSEEGAVVKVDDVAMGSTPLQGRLEVSGGPHYLVLEKEGFTAAQKEVRIKPEELTEESIRLVPSPDFIAAFESKQKKLRIGAYAATGIAVGALAAAIVFEMRMNTLYGTKEKDHTFLFLRDTVINGSEDRRDELNQVKASIAMSQTLGAVFFGVAAAGAIGAGTLFLLGEDPGRYGAYREVNLKASAAPLPGGGLAALSGTW